MGILLEYRKRQQRLFKSGIGEIIDNPGGGGENPGTDGDFKPDPNYVRQGVVMTFIPNAYTEKTLYNDNGIGGTTKYSGLWYKPKNWGTDYGPYLERDADLDPAYVGTDSSKDTSYWYTSTKSGENYRATGSTLGRALGSLAPGAAISKLNHTTLTDSLGNNTGGSANIETTSDTGNVYVQNARFGSIWHDPIKKRNSGKLYSLRMVHQGQPTIINSDGEYRPYLNRSGTSSANIDDIVRAEIGCHKTQLLKNASLSQGQDREEFWGTSFYLDETGRPVKSTDTTLPDLFRSSCWCTGDEVAATGERRPCHIFQLHSPDGISPPVGLVVQENNMFFQIKYASAPHTSLIVPTSVQPENGGTWQRGGVNIRFGKDDDPTLEVIGHSYNGIMGDINTSSDTLRGQSTAPNGHGRPIVGQWVDMVIHAKWDWRSAYKRNSSNTGIVPATYGVDYDGIFEVWLAYRPYPTTANPNPKRILRKWFSYKGPNCYGGDTTPYFKQGVYYRHLYTGSKTATGTKSWAHYRRSWIDEIRLARNVYSGSTKTYSAKMEDVLPSGLD